MIRRRTLVAASSALVLASTAGCGLLGDEDAPEPTPEGSPVERVTLRVAVLPSAEVAPLKLAVDLGLFRERGLTDVRIEVVGSGQAATERMIGGDFDVVYSSHVPLIRAQATESADLRIVTDNSSAAPNTAMLVAGADSPVMEVKQLAGKKIAVPAVNTLADLMVKSVLADHQIDLGAIKWVPMSFSDAPAALARGDLDAAMMVEPWVTASGMDGTRPLIDLASGPLTELPFTAYAATAQFTRDNPKTVVAFQRAMIHATNLANADRKLIEPVVAEFTTMPTTVTKLMALPRFGATLDSARIQRVADLMTRFGLLPEQFEVATMLQPPPPPA